MADSGRGFLGKGKILLLESEGKIYQGDQHRHLDQRPDDRGKGLTGIDAENGDGHGDGQLEVVGGGGEGEGGRLFVGGADACIDRKKESTNMTRK